MYGLYLTLVLFSLGNVTNCKPSFEPHCSKFDYDEKLLEKMVRMEHANEVMFKNVEDFKDQAKRNLDSGMEGLEERVMQKMGQLEDANEVVLENVKEFTDTTKQNLETLQKELDKKLSNITSLDEPSSKSSKTQTAYGFLAYWLTNLSPAESEAIVFSRTIFDKGSVYNNITGKFTAPVPGVYHLTASLCATSGSWIRLQFMADGARIGAFIVGDRDWFTCSSGSAIAFLEKGSTVWLRRVNVHSNTEKFANNNSDYFHSFTGLLIHETHPDSDN